MHQKNLRVYHSGIKEKWRSNLDPPRQDKHPLKTRIIRTNPQKCQKTNNIRLTKKTQSICYTTAMKTHGLDETQDIVIIGVGSPPSIHR
jgi:hypothetical protein